MIVKIIIILSFLPVLLLMAYPVISFFRYTFFPVAVLKSEKFLVPVSIIIACYNEEKYIQSKILSFLDESDWIPNSEIIVVSGGSTDNTNTILHEFHHHPSVIVVLSPVQMSKIESVNLAVESARNEILVFSDCRQKMEKGSVKQLVYNFNDKNVGTVVAKLEDPDQDKKHSFFRSAINQIVFMDSQSGSALHVYGAMYAQRKSIFKKFPPNQLFDDLCVIISTLSHNKRLIQEPLAKIYDVNFNTYYGGERLERLTRGLLIFLTKNWSQIVKINKIDLFRFFTFKYVKLLLPFSFISGLLLMAYWLTETTNYFFPIFILSTFIVLLLLKSTRTFLLLLVRINFHFIMAIIKFFVFNKRSNSWEKLIPSTSK